MGNSGQYFLPAEFAILLVVWLAPPLLIAFGFQAVTLRKRGRSTSALLACFLLTALFSTAAFIGLLVTNSRLLKEINSALAPPAPYEFLVMPFAFIAVGIVAALVAVVFARPFTQAKR